MERQLLRYFPIECGVDFDILRSDLLRVNWQPYDLSADFALPDKEGKALRVSFRQQTIIRILEEGALCTESAFGQAEGLGRNQFAYRVEGAAFAEIQSEVWREIHGPVQHYQFLTGYGCMDVLCGAFPVFAEVTIGGVAMTALER